jgi:AcrR family transcriptional regulator
MVLESGYASLAMDTVASTLGISKGTLYARHPSKEELLYAVVKDSLESWSAASSLTDPLLPSDLAPRLRARLVEIGRTLSKPEVEAYYQLGASIRHRVPEVAALFYESGFLRGVEVIADDIRTAAVTDRQEARDPDAAASHLLYTFLGWHMQESAVRELDEADVAAFAGRAVDFFMLARSAW